VKINQKPSISIKEAKSKLYTLGKKFETQNWQSIKAPDDMLELINHSFQFVIPQTLKDLREEIKPNLPWADDHFLERVGGEPINPGEQYKNWPFYVYKKGNDKFRTVGEEQFSHSYMERIWTPKLKGIRYDYGNFGDVIDMMKDDPTTRQAFLPIFFPEDTGAVHKERIPCTLGYHFIQRYGFLHIIYYMRSCDYLRHFRDDIYLACRKAHWLLEQLRTKDAFWNDVQVGTFTMHITSLHCFWKEKEILKMERS
jgi:hypothetical protein